MKTIATLLLGLSMLPALSGYAAAQLPSQPFTIPEDGDYGVYAVQDQSVGPTDEFLAKAYDNFSLDVTASIDAVRWTGVYAEPLPASPASTDFLIEFWHDVGGLPDLDNGPIAAISLDGGIAGANGPDVDVTPLSHTSPSTNFTPGGGPAFTYEATIPTTTLLAGDYFISILADQTFTSMAPIIDPEWQWHLGSGPGDGFYAYDRLLDPAGTPEYGYLQDGVDLAFELEGTLVPEPTGLRLAFLSLAALAVRRRKRPYAAPMEPLPSLRSTLPTRHPNGQARPGRVNHV